MELLEDYLEEDEEDIRFFASIFFKKYNFLRIVYELEQHGKLIFMDEDQNQWSSGYIYYSPERNAIIIEYGESGRKMIEIPEGWEL